MIELPPPPFGVTTVISALAVGPNIARVITVRAALIEGEDAYLDAGATGTISLLDKRHADIVETEDEYIRYAYTQLRDKRSRARALYNFIEASTPYRKCSLCGDGTVFSLDHHLPQDEFARFAIVPANLVPVCARCNTIKSNYATTVADRAPLHPYFDRLGAFDWVTGVVVEDPEAPIRFELVRPARWDDTLHARVQQHFLTHVLSEVWSTSASAQLASQRRNLRGLGEAEVSSELRKAAQGFLEGPFPWVGVAMNAWADSAWFCGGGWDVRPRVATP